MALAAAIAKPCAAAEASAAEAIAIFRATCLEPLPSLATSRAALTEMGFLTGDGPRDMHSPDASVKALVISREDGGTAHCTMEFPHGGLEELARQMDATIADLVSVPVVGEQRGSSGYDWGWTDRDLYIWVTMYHPKKARERTLISLMAQELPEDFRWPTESVE
jgi:hypothetical protein